MIVMFNLVFIGVICVVSFAVYGSTMFNVRLYICFVS